MNDRDGPPRRIDVWSGPRNISTALMYAFAQRDDVAVVDEPLYAAYLTATGLDHPGRDDVLAEQSHDPAEVLADVLLDDVGPRVLVAKQMAHHRRAVPDPVLAELDATGRAVVLCREPRAVVRSFARQVERPTLADLGYVEQVELLDAGLAVAVVDSARLLADPPGVLQRLCERLGIVWDPAMLAWPAGPRPEDGPWAPHWYANVHASTGFAPPRPPDDTPLADDLESVVGRARPLYERLAADAL